MKASRSARGVASFSISRIALLCIAVITLSMKTVFAGWSVCNKSPYPVWVAVAWDENGSYASRGWWHLGACGACAVVLSGRPATAGVFVYAVTDSDEPVLAGSNNLFCVRDDAFLFRRENAVSAPNQCSQSGGHRVDFMLSQLQHGSNVSTDIVGRSLNGSTCID